MNLKDLPENIQADILRMSNTYMRNRPELDIHLTKHIDQAVIYGMEYEARRHNSKAESLWQILNAVKIILQTDPVLVRNIAPEVLTLVDECLKENKPEII